MVISRKPRRATNAPVKACTDDRPLPRRSSPSRSSSDSPSRSLRDRAATSARRGDTCVSRPSASTSISQSEPFDSNSDSSNRTTSLRSARPSSVRMRIIRARLDTKIPRLMTRPKVQNAKAIIGADRTEPAGTLASAAMPIMATMAMPQTGITTVERPAAPMAANDMSIKSACCSVWACGIRWTTITAQHTPNAMNSAEIAQNRAAEILSWLPRRRTVVARMLQSSANPPIAAAQLNRKPGSAIALNVYSRATTLAVSKVTLNGKNLSSAASCADRTRAKKASLCWRKPRTLNQPTGSTGMAGGRNIIDIGVSPALFQRHDEQRHLGNSVKPQWQG